MAAAVLVMATAAIATDDAVPGGMPHARTVLYAYVADTGQDAVTPISLSTGRPGIATAYVVSSYDTVTPISLATGRPGTVINLPNGSEAIAITPNGKTAYVADNQDGAVTPITLATGRPGAPIPVGTPPIAIAITPDGKTAYVTNNGDSTVTPINLATGRPGTPIKVGEAPNAIAIIQRPGATPHTQVHRSVSQPDFANLCRPHRANFSRPRQDRLRRSSGPTWIGHRHREEASCQGSRKEFWPTSLGPEQVAPGLAGPDRLHTVGPKQPVGNTSRNHHPVSAPRHLRRRGMWACWYH